MFSFTTNLPSEIVTQHMLGYNVSKVLINSHWIRFPTIYQKYSSLLEPYKSLENSRTRNCGEKTSHQDSKQTNEIKLWKEVVTIVIAIHMYSK